MFTHAVTPRLAPSLSAALSTSSSYSPAPPRPSPSSTARGALEAAATEGAKEITLWAIDLRTAFGRTPLLSIENLRGCPVPEALEPMPAAAFSALLDALSSWVSLAPFGRCSWLETAFWCIPLGELCVEREGREGGRKRRKLVQRWYENERPRLLFLSLPPFKSFSNLPPNSQIATLV